MALLLFSFAQLRPELAVAAGPKKKRAEALATQAVKLFREKMFADAASLFLEAYEISKEPTQLRNAARAFEEGGIIDRALECWQSYRDAGGLLEEEVVEAETHLKLLRELEAAKDAEEAARAEAARKVETATLADEPEVKEALEHEPEPSASAPVVEESSTPVLGYVTLAGSAVFLAASVVLWIVAAKRLSALDEKLAASDLGGLMTQADVDRETRVINAERIASISAGGLGLIALAAGITAIVTWSADPAAPLPAVAPSLDGEGNVAGFRVALTQPW